MLRYKQTLNSTCIKVKVNFFFFFSPVSVLLRRKAEVILDPPTNLKLKLRRTCFNSMILCCNRKTEQEKAVNRAAACRVCLKTIKAEEISRTCYECQRKVCEDCASYSTTANSNDPVSSFFTPLGYEFEWIAWVSMIQSSEKQFWILRILESCGNFLEQCYLPKRMINTSYVNFHHSLNNSTKQDASSGTHLKFQELTSTS